MELMSIINKFLYRTLFILAILHFINSIIKEQLVYSVVGIVCLVIATLLYKEEKSKKT